MTVTNKIIKTNPIKIPGMLKNKVYTVINVINELFFNPRHLNTPNSNLLSSISVYINENIRMKLKKQTKNITVVSTLFNINSITC